MAREQLDVSLLTRFSPGAAELSLVDALAVAAPPTPRRATDRHRRHRRLPEPPYGTYDPHALTEPAELRLHDTLDKTRAALNGITDLDHFTSATTDLNHAVTEFFDQVYVMDDDPERRAARLGLLATITDLGQRTLTWHHLRA